MIKLSSNPFYILRATPRDNKQRLSELCDERSLLGNAAECENAFAILCNPKRRLEAEAYWFTFVTDGMIYKAIDVLDDLKYETILKRNPVEQAIIFLNSDSLDMDYRSSTHSELLVNLYAYDIQILLDEINQNRLTAGFPQITGKAELEGYINVIKREIINRIFKPFEYIGIELSCGEVARFMQDNCAENHVLLDDVANYYRGFALIRLEKMRIDIENLCESITGQVNKVIEDNRVTNLIAMVTEYAAIDEPLLTYTKITGNPYEETRLLLSVVRSLYLKLNDYFGYPEKALSVAKLLYSKFNMIHDVTVTEPPLIETLEKNVESAAERNKALYEADAKKAREREIREAEEHRRQQAQQARQQELERNAAKQNKSAREKEAAKARKAEPVADFFKDAGTSERQKMEKISNAKQRELERKAAEWNESLSSGDERKVRKKGRNKT